MKCYAPSREPIEGVRILEALRSLLHRPEFAQVELVIKPHPTDLTPAYEEILAGELSGRVRITDQSLAGAFESADLVIAEDTTAALDAMIRGLPIVHAHFAASEPVLPIVAFGAGLPGFDGEQLGDSLRRVTAAGPEDRRRMWAGQREFIHAFAGPMDGRQTARAVTFIEKVVGAG